jgi:hypothetical protein
MLDSLKVFPGELSSVDAECREILIDELVANPEDDRQWSRFLSNERALLERARKLELLDVRFKIARQFVSSKVADVMEIEVRSKDVSEKRNGFGALSARGSTSSRLFLAWAQLERAEKSLDKAREVVELGIKVGAPTSPGRMELQKELDRIKDEQQVLLVQPAAGSTVSEEAGTVKKPRTSLPSRRRLLGSIGGPARIKPGEQKQIVEEEIEIPPPPAQAAPVIVAPPPVAQPPSPTTESDEGSNRNNNRRVKFASPAQAPVGPRVVALRPGSMSPTPAAATTGGQGMLTAMRNRSSFLDASPKRSDEPSFSQTPMHPNNRADKYERSVAPPTPLAPAAAAAASAAASAIPAGNKSEFENSPSRVLFQSAVKPRVPSEVEETQRTIPQQQQQQLPLPPPLAFLVDHGAPVVVPPPPRQASAPATQSDEDEGFYRQGEEVTLNSRKLRILAVMGKGGYSRVYRVLDCNSFELFALKDVNQEAEKEDKSFQNEVMCLTQLAKQSRRDPAIRNRVVQMVDFHETPERSFVLLELGELDLIRLLARARRERANLLPMMEMTEIRHYWPQMLRCIAVLHEHGFVHCDLKPGNFAMFQGRIKVIDFGIAVSQTKPEPQTRGTLNYLPPELCLSLLERKRYPFEPPQPPRDVWAMGCILYELAYGRPPFFTNKGTQKERSDFLIRQIADPKHAIPFQNSESVELLNNCVAACMRHLPSERPSAKSLIANDMLE